MPLDEPLGVVVEVDGDLSHICTIILASMIWGTITIGFRALPVALRDSGDGRLILPITSGLRVNYRKTPDLIPDRSTFSRDNIRVFAVVWTIRTTSQ